MNICVIKPSMSGRRTKAALTPLLFAILKPLTPPEVQLTFCDENIEPVPEYLSCGAAAISIDTFTARRGYFLAANFRARGVPVIIGGLHASLCPDEAACHADTVVIGEAEDTWGSVVADLCAGALKPRYVSGNAADLGSVVYDYTVFAGKKYNPIGIVQFTRGCKFNCDFCSVHAIYGQTFRTRPPAAVVETILQIPNKLLFFTDDNLFSNPMRADGLIAAMEPLKRRWVCQISMDAARDLSLLRRMSQSGCIMVLIGFESLNDDNLRSMNKSANLAADCERVISNVRRAGLMLYGMFVIGYDADTPNTAHELAVFAKKHGFAIANLNPLFPTPGAPLYERLKQENRLLYEAWWNDPAYRYGDSAFQPKSMSPSELAESCRRGRYEFYSARGIFARLSGVNTKGLINLAVYLLTNIISGIEVRHKQGRGLG